MDFTEMAGVIVALIIFVVAPLLAFFLLIRKQEKNREKRDAFLVQKFGTDTKIYRGFPFPANAERIVQGALGKFTQDYREIIITPSWLYIQITSRHLPRLTRIEDRNAGLFSIYAVQLSEYSPTMLVQNADSNSLALAYYQDRVATGEFTPSELSYGGSQRLYSKPNEQVQTLQIMSPEVLETLTHAPYGADIFIKKDYLYYLIPGDRSIENTIDAVKEHARKVEIELTDNLARWAGSTSNSDVLSSIESSELGQTLVEATQKAQDATNNQKNTLY